MRNYTRWTATEAGFVADLVDARHSVVAVPTTGMVALDGDPLSPDAARLIGVRLIEAAALADGERAIRSAT